MEDNNPPNFSSFLSKNLQAALQTKELNFKKFNPKGYIARSLLAYNINAAPNNFNSWYCSCANMPKYSDFTGTFVYSKMRPHAWRIYASNIASNSSYSLADIIRSKYLNIAEKYNFMNVLPQSIKIGFKNSEHEEIKQLSDLKNCSQEEINKKFLTTCLGQKVKATLDEFGLKLSNNYSVVNNIVFTPVLKPLKTIYSMGYVEITTALKTDLSKEF